jgi:hypothetical protein
MATLRHSVELVPYGFFEHNPSLDLHRNADPRRSLKN